MTSGFLCNQGRIFASENLVLFPCVRWVGEGRDHRGGAKLEGDSHPALRERCWSLSSSLPLSPPGRVFPGYGPLPAQPSITLSGQPPVSGSHTVFIRPGLLDFGLQAGPGTPWALGLRVLLPPGHAHSLSGFTTLSLLLTPPTGPN